MKFYSLIVSIFVSFSILANSSLDFTKKGIKIDIPQDMEISLLEKAHGLANELYGNVHAVYPQFIPAEVLTKCFVKNVITGKITCELKSDQVSDFKASVYVDVEFNANQSFNPNRQRTIEFSGLKVENNCELCKALPSTEKTSLISLYHSIQRLFSNDFTLNPIIEKASNSYFFLGENRNSCGAYTGLAMKELVKRKQFLLDVVLIDE